MELIQIANLSSKNIADKKTIRYTQSICPDCNMILDAEVFEKRRQGLHDQNLPNTWRMRGTVFWLLQNCTKSLAPIGWTEKAPMLQM